MTDDLISEIGGETHSDPTDTLCCGPSDDAIVVFKAIKKVLDDELKLFDLVVVELFLTSDVLFILFHLLIWFLLGLCSDLGMIGDNLSSNA